jgi:hypothetical protein
MNQEIVTRTQKISYSAPQLTPLGRIQSFVLGSDIGAPTDGIQGEEGTLVS